MSYLTVVPDTTKRLSSVAIKDVSGTRGGRQLLELDRSAAAGLEVGDIINAGITPETPYGLLARVRSLAPHGQLVRVSTAPATLREAVPSGELGVKTALSRASFSARSDNPIGRAIRKAFSCGASLPVSLDGQVRLAPSLDFSARWSLRGAQARFTVRLAETAQLTATAQGTANCSIKGAPLGPPIRLGAIVVPIGPVVIVIVPTLEFKLDASASVSGGLTSTVTQRFTATAGAEYADGRFRPISHFENRFEYTPPSAFVSGTVSGGVDAELSILLYGAAGPYAVVGTGLDFQVNPLATPWWELGAGLHAGGGMKLSALGFKLGYENRNLIKYHRVLARSTGTIGPPPPPPPPPGPTPPPPPTPPPSPPPDELPGAPRDQRLAALAFDGTNYLVVWSDERFGLWTREIYAARVSPSGRVLDPVGIPIATGATESKTTPQVAFDGTNYLIVWREGPSASGGCVSCPAVYGARVSRTGTILDPGGFLVADTVDWRSAGASVAFDGTNYLVVWDDERSTRPGESDLYGARVSPTGALLDPTGFPIAPQPGDQRNPTVAFDGTHYVVAWDEFQSGGGVYATRVSPAGAVLDPNGIGVASAGWFPAVAFDGTNSLIVWQDSRPPWGLYSTYGARLNASGTVLDPAGIRIGHSSHRPALAFGGDNYLVAWGVLTQHNREDIYAQRVSPQGLLLDLITGIPMTTAPWDQDRPALAFDGTNYFVVWEDIRSSSHWDIYGARVSRVGSVLDPNGIIISTTLR